MLNILLSIVLETFLLNSFNKNIYVLKDNSSHQKLLFYSLEILIYFILNVLGVKKLNFFILLFFNILITKKFYICSFLNALFSSACLLVLSSLSEVIIGNSILLFMNNPEIANIYSIEFTFGLILSKAFEFIIVFIISRFIRVVLKKHFPKYLYFILILPLTTIILINNIQNYMLVSNQHGIKIFILIICMLLSNLFTLHIFVQIINSMTVKQELAYFKARREIESINIDILHNLYNSYFNILHDVRNKLSNIIDHSTKKDYKSIQSITLSLYDDLQSILTTTCTGPEIFQLAVENIISKISKMKIDFSTQINDFDVYFMDSFDQLQFYSVFFNYCLFSLKNIENDKFLIIKGNKFENKLILSAKINTSNKELPDFPENLNAILIKYNGTIIKKITPLSTSIIVTFSEVA